jgi:hypothetical protein
LSLGQGRIGLEHAVDVYARAYKVLSETSPKYAQLLQSPASVSILGYGMLGHVYTTRNPDRVLKLTADASELIMGRWFEARRRWRAYRGIVRVYDTQLVPLGRRFVERFRANWPEEYDPGEFVHVTGRKRRGFKLQNWDYSAYPVTLPTHIVAILREPIIATEGVLRKKEYRKQFRALGYRFDAKWTRAAKALDTLSEAADILRASLEPAGEGAPDAATVREVRDWLQQVGSAPGVGWLATAFLAMHGEGIGIADLHEENLGVTRRAYHAMQFILFDFGVAYSSHPMHFPQALEGYL